MSRRLLDLSAYLAIDMRFLKQCGASLLYLKGTCLRSVITVSGKPTSCLVEFGIQSLQLIQFSTSTPAHCTA